VAPAAAQPLAEHLAEIVKPHLRVPTGFGTYGDAVRPLGRAGATLQETVRAP
jgi:hypothetical protein